MSLQNLTDAESRVVVECLRAAVEGPFFPDWEFSTLFGLERHEVARILALAPSIDDTQEEVDLAINNSLGNLIGYPHGQQAVWCEFISVPKDEVVRIFEKWRGDTSFPRKSD